MRRNLSVAVFFLIPVLITGCGAAGRKLQLSNGEFVEAVLTATPTQGMQPLDVAFVVELKGGPEDARELYCLDYEWVFDRESKNSQTQDCGDYQPGVPVERMYTTTYRFDAIGTYRVRFQAKGGLIRSNTVRVTVRYNPFREPDDTRPPQIRP